MEKTKVLCLILAIVLASAGTAGIVMGFGGESVAPPLPDNSANAVMDKPVEGDPRDRTPIENLYIAQGELQRKGGFVGETRGTTTSAGIKQEVINNRVVIGGNVFKEMITIGVVKNAYQLFMYNGNYLYRKYDNIRSANSIQWSDTASKYSEEDFLFKFGHRSDSLTGYILNDDTIESGVLEKEENGLFQYRYVLDIETAPARMLYEMKTNSNMSGYSTFIKAEIVVVMDADWQVKTVTTDCKYKVPMFGGLDCVEDITETFSDVSGADLPEKDFFERFFDATLESPVDKDPDALSVLMDIFAPYIGGGNSLNASIIGTSNGQKVLDGLVSANIDIENLDNIEVAAKFGSDLYIEYCQGSLYVTYQDFKARTTVDGIMGAVGALIPQADAASADDGNGILDNLTYSVNDGLCTVSLPLELGSEKIEIGIYAAVTDNGYQFKNARAVFGSLELNIELASAFGMPERSGEYPEILGLLDIVQNGVIYGNVNAFNMDVDVMFDIANQSLYATGDNLSVIYNGDAIYAELGAIKAKLNVSDIERIATLLRLAGIADVDFAAITPQISVEQILTLLSDIQATVTDNGVKLSLGAEDLSADVYLVSADSGWNLDKVTIEFSGNIVTIAVSAPFETEIHSVDGSEYADVMDLAIEFINPIASIISASSYGVEFGFDVTANNKIYNAVGSFIYDSNKNVCVNAEVTSGAARLVETNVIVADGVVYLAVNGIKTAFAVGKNTSKTDITELVNQIYGLNNDVDGVIEAVCAIVDAAKSLDFSSVDLTSLIKRFRYADGELALTVDADFVGLGDIDVLLSVNEYNSLTAKLDGLTIGDIRVGANAVIKTNVAKIAIPSGDDYILNLKGSVQDVRFAVSADLLNMDISASVDVLNQTILIRLLDGKVYATVGEIAVAGAIDELGEIIGEIMTIIGADASDINLGGLESIDLSIETILSAISVDIDGALSIGLTLGNSVDVSVDFDSEAKFVAVTANIAGYSVNLTASDIRVPQLDVNDIYISVKLLAKQALEIYNNFKNISDSGIEAALKASIKIDNVDYLLDAVVRYNNGLYVNALICQGKNALAALELYLVNNVLYLDVNGVRVATELSEVSLADGANTDVAAILAVLGKVKGYNAVLDSVIAVAEQLPDRLNGVEYLDLLASLTYDNDTLSAIINGGLLGLSDFAVTLSGTSNITATVNDLTIGGVTIADLKLGAAPSCSPISAPASEYVTELEIEASGLSVIAKLDMLNKSVTASTVLLGHELGLYLANNTVFVKYGAVNAKLDLADADKLLSLISMFADKELPALDMPSIDVKQILNGISIAFGDSGYELKAAVGDVRVTAAFDTNAKLTNANVNVNDFDVAVSVINGAAYPLFDVNADYIDLVALIETYAGDIRRIIDAEGYEVALNGSFAFDNNVYNVNADITFNGGLYVDANVSYNTANLINVRLWCVDNTLYLSSGDLKLALALPQTAKRSGAENIDLSALKGYNPYVDGVIDAIQGIVDKLASGGVDYVALIDGLTCVNGELTLMVNGNQLGLAPFAVKLNADNGVYVNVFNLAIDKLTANVNVGVKESKAAVTAPTGDFTTNLSIRIDDKNTIYANLDLINGVYNFRLDDLYVMYADGSVKINKGDIYLSGNIKQIMDYVKKIDELVNEFSGATESSMAGIDFDAFKNIDIKSIVKSLAISVDGEKAILSANALGFDVKAILAYGRINSIIVPVSLIDKTLQIEACKPQLFDKFDGESIQYIQIEQIFNDYFPAIERLVHTNSWKFVFDGDTMLAIDKTSYKVAAGSYFEFYYKNTEGFDTLKLRAKLDVYKQKADGSWQEFMSLDIVYKDGNIYVTDTGRKVGNNNRNTIKLTVSVDTLVKCYDLYDEIVAVVPQIGKLIDDMKTAMSEAEKNAESISYSTILSDVSYVNDVFGLTLNGKALLSKLGLITLSAQTYGEGLSLNELRFAYDGISVQINNLRVSASELVETDGITEYAAVADINSYDTADHMDFNSLYELLSSFVITATPNESDNGSRSFYVDGSALVKLSSLAQLKMGLSVKVDITPENDVFISAKIHRSQPSGISAIAYNDKGGDSYLNYSSIGNNGAGSFTVIRDSMKETSGTHYEDVEELYYYCVGCDKEAEKKPLSSEYQCPTKSNWLGTKRVHDSSYIEARWRVVNKQVSNTTIDEKNCEAYYNLTTEEFTADIVEYILKMVNLSSMIEKPIKDAINGEKTNDFGIEDLLKNYTYSESDCRYSVDIDLSAIDSNLGAVGLNVIHRSAEDFALTNLNANMNLLNGFCSINLNMTLKPSVCGETISIVENNSRW